MGMRGTREQVRGTGEWDKWGDSEPHRGLWHPLLTYIGHLVALCVAELVYALYWLVAGVVCVVGGSGLMCMCVLYVCSQ